MRLLKNNKGSSIITVLIAMLLISALGATLLFTSYIGYQIKVSERTAKQNFYDAETAVNEIRDSVQQMVTQSIAKAYTQVLVQYNSPDPEEDGDDDTEDKFKTFYRKALFSWKNADNDPLFTTPAGDRYDTAVLLSFVKESEQALTTVKGGGFAAPDSLGRIVLKNIEVRHVRAGFETVITTDIVIGLPEFNYSVAEYALTGIPEFALIAHESLYQPPGSGLNELTLTGNAYAGDIDLQGAGNTLIVDGGTMICGDELNVSGSGYGGGDRLIMQGASLWTNRIVINAYSSLTMTNKDASVSEAYVADDLELKEEGASAILSGRYYGFGNSAADASRSSAILINGQNTELNLSELGTLMLAGHSFVSPSQANAQGSDVLMGQSVSVRSDQMAYLVPAHCMTVKSNPYIYTGDSLDSSILPNEILWGTVKLSSIVPSDAAVKTITYSLGGTSTKIAYFFLDFKTKDYANAYFRDYFQQHSDKIEQYLEIYSDVLEAALSTQSSGSTYDLKDGDLKLISPSGAGGASAIGVSASRLAQMYDNYRVTLSGGIPPPAGFTGTSPYDYLVNKSAVAALTEDVTRFKDEEGNVTAIIVKNAGGSTYLVSGADDDVCVILATGNVTVDKSFKGLIISGGTITMQQSMEASVRLVTGALRAAAQIDGKTVPLYHFLGANVDDSGDAGGDNESTWAVDTLVSYANWRKD